MSPPPWIRQCDGAQTPYTNGDIRDSCSAGRIVGGWMMCWAGYMYSMYTSIYIYVYIYIVCSTSAGPFVMW